MGLFSHSFTAALGYYGAYRFFAYAGLRAVPRDSLYLTPAYLSRAVSAVNSVVLVLGALLYLTGLLSEAAAAWLLQAAPIGYCVYDFLLMCSEAEIFDPVMLGHHAAFAYFPACVYTGYPAEVALGYLSESSVIPLYLCWHLHRTGQTKRALYRYAAAALAVSFFCCRVCIFSWLSVRAFAYEGQYAAGAAVAGLAALNTYWFTRLLAKALAAGSSAHGN
jgi:hypothetical protein